jgi:oxygen-independent coproporphyrinogen III oxidase
MMDLNKDLLQKYNQPVPRYTSYPPANYFSDGFTEGDYKDALAGSNQWSPQNISIYLHIPFCRKMCHYCGCNTSPMAKENHVAEYIDALKKEIAMVAGHIDKNRKVSQVHYGGGTPNAIPAKHLKELNGLIAGMFGFIDRPEIAIECNPDCLDYGYIEDLKAAGFNRFSLGIQDFNLQVLKYVNRDPSAMPVQDIMDQMKAGVPNASVNLDFIYGLPGQSVSSFGETIEQAIALKPDRLVTFSYAHVPWIKKAQNILEKIGLPGPEEKINMFLHANALLKENQYHPIGFDHYVLANDELYKALQSHQLHRNFQGYCTRHTTGQVYAFGVSSISQLEGAYIQNTKSIKDYIATVNLGGFPIIKGYKVRKDEMVVREVINALMCNNRVRWDEIAASFGMSELEVQSHIVLDGPSLSEFEKDGIIDYGAGGISITGLGMLFVRNVAASLDPLYKKQQNLYSKSV